MDYAECKAYFDSPEFEEEYHYDGKLGSFCQPDGTQFFLWAPTAQRVQLNLFRSGDGGEAYEILSLTRGERGIWQLRTPENLHGVYYTYTVTADGIVRETGDPYARACGLNGRRSMVIDLAATDPEDWANDRAPSLPPENIIYEVHVKDFSWDPASGVSPEYRGKFPGLHQAGTTLFGDGIHPTTLDYLKALGITHLELMPVYDYGSVDEAGPDSQFNWGYDPVNYNVPEGSYSTDPFHGEVRIRELKQAIAALHKCGIRVIMDVVYNHTYHLDSCLNRTVPWYYYRQNPDGTPSNGSGCGNDTASERSMCSKYILDSVLYWAEEYHIDGFRFDLMGLLPVALMNRIREALDARFGPGEKILFGEPWRAADTAVRPGTILADKANLSALSDGVGAFCDATRDAVKGSLLHPGARGFVNGGSFSCLTLESCIRGWSGTPGEFSARSPRQTIGYVSSHDDWTLWDRLVNTLDDTRDYTGCSPEILRANRLAAAVLFGCQGSWFLLAGEEFGRTKGGIKNSYTSSPEINRLDWQRAWRNHSLSEYYRGLFALRRQLPALRAKCADAGVRILSVFEPQPGCAAVMLDNTGGESPWRTLLLLYNTRPEQRTIMLPSGSWQKLADDESSFCWQESIPVVHQATLMPISAMILGK